MSFRPKQSNTGHHILYRPMNVPYASQAMFYLSCKMNTTRTTSIIGLIVFFTLTLAVTSILKLVFIYLLLLL
jgi:hypothetical protein